LQEVAVILGWRFWKEIEVKQEVKQTAKREPTCFILKTATAALS
jgi:hypothetical protein